jgi:hypothetical protein
LRYGSGHVHGINILTGMGEHLDGLMTPRVLLDAKNGAPELELIEQLERDGHDVDVMGAKVRILAMRDALEHAEFMRRALADASQKISALARVLNHASEERGKNVLFCKAPNPNDPIERQVWGFQLPARATGKHLERSGL